jgi:2-keto-3-deoxy-L-rhamnonate aldolase RhmA
MALNVTLNFKKELQKGKIVFGQTIGPRNDPDKTVKALKDYGFDFIMMETEHSLVNKETIFEYIRVSREMEMPILMRPEDKDGHFRCYMDAGINGMMLPCVNTVEETIFAIDQCYFSPIGHRGSGVGMSPYLMDSQNLAEMPLSDICGYVNDNVVLFPMTESREGVSNLHRTLALEGVTGTIVGTNDLVLDAYGAPPKMLRSETVTSQIVEDELREIGHTCKKMGKVAGIGGFAPKGLAKWAKEGYQLFMLGYVIDNNYEKLKPAIDEIKSLLGL